MISGIVVLAHIVGQPEDSQHERPARRGRRSRGDVTIDDVRREPAGAGDRQLVELDDQLLDLRNCLGLAEDNQAVRGLVNGDTQRLRVQRVTQLFRRQRRPLCS